MQRIVAIWNAATRRADHSLAVAIESAPDAPARLRKMIRESTPGDFSPRRLVERLDHFVTESCEIIPRAADALARGDMAGFGALAEKSQRGAELQLRNQVPETIALVQMARREGADAASAFGAGFGGSVWALVAAADAGTFVKRWQAAYRADFAAAAEHVEIIVTRAGPAAMALWSTSKDEESANVR